MCAAASRRSARPLVRHSQRSAARSFPRPTVFHPVPPQIGHVSVGLVTVLILKAEYDDLLERATSLARENSWELLMGGGN